MEAMKLSKFDRTFFVLFVDGFESARPRIAQETGGSEEYCINILRQVGGNSKAAMSQDVLIAKVALAMGDPKNFKSEEGVKNIALLSEWIDWLEGLETTGSMKRLEKRLDALKNAK